MDDSSIDTVQLEEIPIYDYHAMIKFCEALGKSVEELSEEEKLHFEI